jgi:hypothetical protein
MSAGFQLKTSQSSGDYCGAIRRFDIPSDNGGRLAIGDVVTLTGDSNTSDGEAEIVIASQSARIAGVIQSFAPDIANESFNDAGGIAASTAGKAFVAVDKNLLFEVECSATLNAADVGLNADAVVTAATQSGGLTVSNMTLDSATKATTATLHFKIHQLLEGATSGTLGDRALVSINGSYLQGDITGV